MGYQSEAELENQLIKQLNEQGYKSVAIKDYDGLLDNFRKQFSAFNTEKLGEKPLSDKEWDRLLNYMLGRSVFESAKVLRDKYVLERDDFFTEYAVVPQVDRRTKVGKETIDVFKREHQKQSWIDHDDFEVIQQMRDALYANAEIKQILTVEHRTEVPFIWVDDETGEICKCKADIITELDGVPTVIDYKTTLSCEDGSLLCYQQDSHSSQTEGSGLK